MLYLLDLRPVCAVLTRIPSIYVVYIDPNCILCALQVDVTGFQVSAWRRKAPWFVTFLELGHSVICSFILLANAY